MNVAIVIPSYNGAWRVQRLLESIEEFDSAMLAESISVFEDPSIPEAHEQYERVLRRYPSINYTRLNEWSNMHGAAQKAFRYVIDHHQPEWVIYLGDDVMVTPAALSHLAYFVKSNALETVGLVGPAYWNAHELSEENYSEHKGPPLLRSKEEMYTKDPSWLLRVPRNPHWDKDGYARPYVNVNGVGFAARASAWDEVGGFEAGTWCLDESVSVKMWLRTPLGVVCCPGQPLVHYFGGATVAGPRPHSLHTAEAWEQAMKMSKEEAGRLCYAAMDERRPAIEAEMRSANYMTMPVSA